MKHTMLSVSVCCQDTTYNLLWHFSVYWPSPSPRPSPRQCPRPSPRPSPSPRLSSRQSPRPSQRPSQRLIFLSAYTLSAQHTELDTDDRQSCWSLNLQAVLLKVW